MYDLPLQRGCNVTLPGPSFHTLCSAAEYFCFMSALNEAIHSNPIISGNCDRIRLIDETAEEYDFVVAGARAGGAVVAARLAEIVDWKILVLEVGEDESAAGQIPIFSSSLIASAKTLGGNTAHNEMVYLRGNPVYFNKWVALGNDDWSWDEVLEFYKKQEDNANIDAVGRRYHSTEGSLPVGFIPYQSEFTEAFMTAAKQSGLGNVSNVFQNSLILIIPIL